MIIYELHVGGFTRHPSSGVRHPGTFLGLIEKIPYLKELGITHVELMPVMAFDEQDVPEPVWKAGLRNFWGYSSFGFFSPHPGFCVTPEQGTHRREFRDMVKALHRAGIGVILDVVFNHTSEGGAGGPTLTFKGFGNETFYCLDAIDKGIYLDFTGCGNTVNANHPLVTNFIIDALEYWVREMHVDGFRFDLASAMARDSDGRPLANPPVLWGIELSDTLAATKIIAEAWDAAGLYQVGTFPGYRWMEWNGRYRDSIRRFVRGDPGLVPEIATRISGSSDLYEANLRKPINSINFVTCHDGFTLWDLVSYNRKHNLANHEGNRDGTDDNLSWNGGTEGETPNLEVLTLRRRQARNLLTLLFLSQGIPMLLAGDEVLRSQQGNNNAWCQDNETGWLDWSLMERNAAMLRFVRGLIALRKRHASLRHRHFLAGRPLPGGNPPGRGLARSGAGGPALGRSGEPDPGLHARPGLSRGGAAARHDQHERSRSALRPARDRAGALVSGPGHGARLADRRGAARGSVPRRGRASTGTLQEYPGARGAVGPDCSARRIQPRGTAAQATGESMARTQLFHALGLHMHQPPGNLRLLLEVNPWEAEEILRCYERAVRYAERYRDVARLHVSFSGVLLEQFLDPDIVDRYRHIVDIPEMLERYRAADNIELLGLGYYHPIFPLIPRADWPEQLERGRAIVERVFGRSPRGFWPPELAFSMEMIPALVQAGYEYVIVDGVHVRPVDGVNDIFRPYVACHDGACITIVPRDHDVSNAQGHGLNPRWLRDELSWRSTVSPRPDEARLVTTWSDGENGGWFRQTHEPSGFFGHFFAPYMEQCRDGDYPITPVLLGDYLDRQRPTAHAQDSDRLLERRSPPRSRISRAGPGPKLSARPSTRCAG
jgi:glycosidase